MAGRRRRPGPGGPPRRDHRPDRPEDDDQRAELRARRSGSPTRRTPPAPPGRTSSRASCRCATRSAASCRSRAPEGKDYEVTAERTPTIVMRPRGWHLAEKHLRFTDRSGRAMAASGSLVDFGLYFFHNAQQLIANGRGPYFYIAKLESQRRGEAVGRRLHVQRAVHRHPARHDPRDGADRDAAGRVRDGGDPLRAARPLRGPERRPLGLHLLDHQELPRPRGAVRAARPQRGHDDRAVHAGLHRAARRRRATSAGPSRSAA